MLYHICNPGTDIPPDSEGWLKNIESEQDLNDLREETTSVYLINIHLNWGGQPYTRDFGFDVANILRTKKASLAPIIFYSPIPSEYFEHKGKGGSDSLKYQILYGRGSAFIAEFPIPERFDRDISEKLFSRVHSLSPPTLHDVVTMLCDLKGFVLDRLNHDLQPSRDPLLTFAEVESFLNSTQKSLVRLEQNREVLRSLYANQDLHGFVTAKEHFLNLCRIELTATGQNANPLPDKKYKVMLVEDDPNQLEAAVNYLETYFEVIAVSEAEEAISLLVADTANEILAVVCDWRLYKSGSKYWQEYQGYEVLEVASKTGRALFALTSQDDFVVHQIRNDLSFKFQLVKKQDFHSEGQKSLFVDWIQNACENTVLNEADIPTAKSWVDYRDAYIELRNSLDWEVFKLCVFSRANEVWAYSLKHGIEGNKLSDQFGLSFKEGRGRSNLFSALVLRLTWFALWHKYGFEAHNQYIELGEFVEYEKNGFETIWDYFIGVAAKPGQMTQDLSKAALNQDDISAVRLFPHERAWLVSKQILEVNVPTGSKQVENTRNEEEEVEVAEEFTTELEAELVKLRNKATAIYVNSVPGEFTDDERIRMNYLNMLAYRSGNP